MEQEQDKIMLQHFINEYKEYKVFKKDFNGKIFYNIQITGTNYDKTKKKGYIQLRFKKDVELQNGAVIKIKEGFPDFYLKDKYTTILTYFVMDFDLLESESMTSAEAIQDYNSSNYDELDLPF